MGAFGAARGGCPSHTRIRACSRGGGLTQRWPLPRVIPPGQGLLGDDGTLVPEPLGSLVVDVFTELIEDDAGEFPRMKASIQRFEAANLLDDRLRDSGRRRLWDHLAPLAEQAPHALPLEATPELAHGFGVG